jgi:TetR/AcrR family transcriptional regulator, fatty acid metabolism regulator protein
MSCPKRMLYDLTVRSDTTTAGQKPRTFTETARRAQIVAAAIDTIAELGYGQASMARIAERVGITKGVIAYHFDGKEELIREIVAEVVPQAEEYMVPRIMAESTGPGMLRAWIESNLEFMGEHRNHLVAVVEIARNARAADGRRLFESSMLEAGAAALEQMLARFQAAGEFRADFDPQVMAGAIRAAIDAVPRALARDPALDVGHHARELATLFDLATRNQNCEPEREGADHVQAHHSPVRPPNRRGRAGAA